MQLTERVQGASGQIKYQYDTRPDDIGNKQDARTHNRPWGHQGLMTERSDKTVAQMIEKTGHQD